MRKVDKMNRVEWEQIGALTKMADDVMTILWLRSCRYFGKSAQVSEEACTIRQKMNELRSHLDDLFLDTNGKDIFGDETLSVFYGDYIGTEAEHANAIVDMITEKRDSTSKEM